MRPLLPHDALAGRRIAISVSDTPDLLRLGFVKTHFQLALGEIARCVLISGGSLAYGGHLQPDGFTAFLIQELERYGRKDRPFVVCLAWHIHRGLATAELEKTRRALGLLGRLVLLTREGEEVASDANLPEGPELITDAVVKAQALTALRRFMAQNTDARVLIGGKRVKFDGDMPGLIEEAIVTLEAGGALYVAAGFGGVAIDIARALDIDDGSWFPGLPGAAPDDQRLIDGVAKLRAVVTAPGWKGLENGLTPDENRLLAVSHRPSEIAALVSLGLGRKLQTAVVREGSS